ncbi:hypothetical protein J0A68_00410 [Algoriphagus sp. H41]|uniref:Phage Mu protein F like protein n=1 Tax=Algoriphagus oliviformis TaxID=2811231 RepID=A0ABS3C1F2_9BACT|nr:hypothetical protein [Algoriphagus oliviformis]MBN7809394.1 hypothetical protein [Algoriphagus oliviformis]
MGKDWNLGFSEKEKLSTKLMREFEFDENLLKNHVEEIRSELATSNLFRYGYSQSHKLEDRILLKLPDFESKFIERYLRDQPDGFAGNLDPTSQRDIVSLFVHYVQFTCYNKAELQEILTYRDKTKYGYKGVEVMTGNDSRCQKCSKIRSTKYSWKELDKVPKIPFFPSCICWYSPIIEQRDF